MILSSLNQLNSVNDMNVLKTAILPLIFFVLVTTKAHSQSADTLNVIIHVASMEIDWVPINQPDFPEGLMAKRLHNNSFTNGGASLLKFPIGFAEPRHFHTTAGHSIYVLSGRINFSGVEAIPGHFFYTPPNVIHELIALEASEVLIWSDGPLDFHLSEANVKE